MRSDPAVSSYLEAASDTRQPMLATLRAECQKALTGFDECIDHGMPSYRRDGTVEIAFADQKQYLSFYVLRNDVMDAHRDRLGGIDTGKGCIRYRRAEQIDVDTVRSILQATAASKGPVCD